MQVDPKGHLVVPALVAYLERLGWMDSQEVQGSVVLQVLQDLLDQPDVLGDLEILEQLDRLDHLDCQEVVVSEVSQESLGFQVVEVVPE